MGAALATADAAVFTADNPRSEDPRAIIDSMLGGVGPRELRRVRVELDRRRAIHEAVRLADPGDVVVLAGKGHERSQEVAGTKHAWDDAAALRLALATRLPPRGSSAPART
jgi:UDP-N-acetylmuramoyl-L-alanyl-D-glutamate--2,6-diaminopimelate ligase